MTPSATASVLRDGFAAAPGGKVGFVTKPGVFGSPLDGINNVLSVSNSSKPQGDTSTLGQKFFAKLYSNKTISNAADSIIGTGQKVRALNNEVISTAKQGLFLGLEFGPLLLVLIAAFLVYREFR